MKKIFFLSVFTILFFVSGNTNANCIDYCEYGDCSVNFYQFQGGWGMDIQCGDQPKATPYTGNGQYEGTICGGYSPCSDTPVEN